MSEVCQLFIDENNQTKIYAVSNLFHYLKECKHKNAIQHTKKSHWEAGQEISVVETAEVNEP